MVSPRNTVTVLDSVEPALELVRKYNVPGPRYTSYPTAPQFSEAIDRAALLREIALDNVAGTSPLSLYFHLPFCETLCWYCGCTTVITRRRASAGEYVTWLEKELALTAPLLNSARPVTQLHFGGGTPTFLPPVEIDRLAAAIHRHFKFSPDSENSVEIDPRRAFCCAENGRRWREALGQLGRAPLPLNRQQTPPPLPIATRTAPGKHSRLGCPG